MGESTTKGYDVVSQSKNHAFAIIWHAKAARFFVSRLFGPRVCGRQEKKRKKNTLSTRGCSFWVPLNTRGGALHARHMAKNTHWTREGAVLSTTEHERVPYTDATRCTRRYKSTYTHWKDVNIDSRENTQELKFVAQKDKLETGCVEWCEYMQIIHQNGPINKIEAIRTVFSGFFSCKSM